MGCSCVAIRVKLDVETKLGSKTMLELGGTVNVDEVMKGILDEPAADESTTKKHHRMI